MEGWGGAQRMGQANAGYGAGQSATAATAELPTAVLQEPWPLMQRKGDTQRAGQANAERLHRHRFLYNSK